jgi:hypothetical protein
VSHSVSQSELARPLALDVIHSGWYRDERGKCPETSSLSEIDGAPKSRTVHDSERLSLEKPESAADWQQRAQSQFDATARVTPIGEPRVPLRWGGLPCPVDLKIDLLIQADVLVGPRFTFRVPS